MNVHKIVKLSFILVTIALSSVALYNLNTYYGTFFAVRGLQLSVDEFSVDLLNATSAAMKTLVRLSNPSGYSFSVGEVHEALYLGEDLIVAFARYPPTEVRPHSNVSIQLMAPVPSEKVSLITELGDKTLFLITSVTLSGPLVGSFSLDDYKTVTIS